MGNKYLIKEAAKLVDVEPHVLRYWEEELDMRIKRNDMGHRYYDEQDIRILKKIKELKDRGIQLKAIHELVQKMYDILENGESNELLSDSKNRNATVVYSGGDDLFIVGAWNDSDSFLLISRLKNNDCVNFSIF